MEGKSRGEKTSGHYSKEGTIFARDIWSVLKEEWARSTPRRADVGLSAKQKSSPAEQEEILKEMRDAGGKVVKQAVFEEDKRLQIRDIRRLTFYWKTLRPRRTIRKENSCLLGVREHRRSIPCPEKKRMGTLETIAKGTAN